LALLFLPPFQLLYRSVAAYGRELLSFGQQFPPKIKI